MKNKKNVGRVFPLLPCNYKTTAKRHEIAEQEIKRLTMELNSAMLFFYKNYGTMCEVVWHKGTIINNQFLEVNVTCTPDKCNWNGSLSTNH